MTPPTVGLIGVGLSIALMFIGVPIGLAMALAGFGGLVYLVGISTALSTIGLIPFSTTTNYTLSVLPLFMLMGQFATVAGITRGGYTSGQKLLGHLPGGLAMANIVACAGFAAVSGSSLASAATMGSTAMPEMRRHKYDPGLAAGSIAAGGTLAIMIPPSTSMVLYSLITEQSIGKLLIAGIVPGIMLAILFMATIYIMVKRKPSLAPPVAKAPLKDRLLGFVDSWPIFVLFLIVIGGIYGGVFTATEAAAVGTFGAFLFLVFMGQLNRKTISASLLDAGRVSAMIFTIVIGAFIFSNFLAVSRLPIAMADWVSTLPFHKYGILAVILSIYVPLGMVMDTLAMILLTLPIVFPIVQGLGFDPIWFGVIVTLMMEQALLTPPVGMNVFVLAGIVKDVPTYTIFRGAFPFLLAMLAGLILLIIFPQIALFLPHLMVGR